MVLKIGERIERIEQLVQVKGLRFPRLQKSKDAFKSQASMRKLLNINTAAKDSIEEIKEDRLKRKVFIGAVETPAAVTVILP